MKKKITYSDMPLGKIKVIKSFLPKPEELAFNLRRGIEHLQQSSKHYRFTTEEVMRLTRDDD